MARLILTWLLALFACASPALAQESSGWWNKEWPYRRAVTIDTSPSGVNLAGPIGRSVVLVRLHSGNFTFTDALENGADLRLVDSDGKTPLPFHIERFDAQNGMATLWVSVPNLNGGEKRRVWVYYGNKNAPAGSDVAGTYDPDTVAAWHFSENAGQAAQDLTSYHNNAQNAVPGVDENGVIARSAKFTGAGALTVPASGSLAIAAGGPMTVSLWAKPDQAAGEQALFARGPVLLGLANGVPFAEVAGQRIQAAAAVKPGEWTHLALVADGQALRLYVGGVEAAAGAGALPALGDPILLGGTADRPFTGELDEVRLAKTARPAAMLLAAAQSEGPTAKLVSVADKAERQSAGGGTFFFVLGKVELIDAFIIGLCLVILALAIVVIVAKNGYLNASARANRVFQRRFGQLHEQLVPMDQLADMSPRELAYIEKSPLGRLYATGIEEMALRRGRGLSPEAVEAMRAAVDAEVVAESQKLDRWMVLLTIAISGGPFIGLLGTVLGVMNTFAGVALAGDVNVNAIAPGIAAALMATIAGLACAIPSLFGYNYLNSRISALSDEMRVFVDRLVTRLAEMQREAMPATRRAGE